jgi:surface protein
MNKKTIIATNKAHLQELISGHIKLYGNQCVLNHLDVSQITDMSELFSCSEFNGNISKWNVSNVKNMWATFSSSRFNGDISTWDVSKVENMTGIFANSNFNGDISGWNVSNVQKMDGMFYSSEFNGDISKWDVSNVKNMQHMFFNSQFDTEKNNLNDWQPVLANIKKIFNGDYTKNKPYWANYEDIKERKGASDNYNFKKKLDNNLNDKNYNKTKIKI